MPEPDLRALTALHRLRRIETDEARRDLGEALTHETVLADRDAAIGAALGEARRMSGDFDREAFSAWLTRMHAERGLLMDAVRGAEARTAAARLTLAHRRLAETAADEALARAVVAAEVVVAQRDQVMLEDVARALKRAAAVRGRN
jgi:hypothetical protein